MVLKNPKFLLVQGRALLQSDTMQSFPYNWEEEIPLIQQIGFSGIEWIYDKKSQNYNPITTKQGQEKIKEITTKYNIKLENIVLDWFMEYPLLSNDILSIDKKCEKLELLIQQSANAGFKRIIFPILEKNSIQTKMDKFEKIMNKKIVKLLDEFNIEFHLETDLPVEKEYQLKENINHDKILICYDMGNSASFGYDPTDTIEKLKNYIGSVHIKDRMLNGGSVPLGEGNVKFSEVFKKLSEINFDGQYTFQIFRNKDSDNQLVLMKGLRFINNIINAVNNGKS